MKKSGFTLVELMIIIAIIGILAAALLPAYNSYIDRGHKSRANTDMRLLQKAILQLAIDTGKWPRGCPVNQANNPEVFLNDPQSGLMVRPTDFTLIDGVCQWSPYDGWAGPYIDRSPIDPWGTSYYFDTDYIICSKGVDEAIPAIVSFGKNKQENYPNCAASGVTDDIYFRLES